MRIVAGITCLVMLIFVLAAGANAKTILVVESYHSDFAWDRGYIDGLAQALGSGVKMHLFALDTKRIPDKRFKEKAREALKTFEALKPDLVVLADDNANLLLAPELLHRGVPIVYMGVNDNPRRYGLYGYPHVAGLMERPLIIRSVHLARKISPFPLRKMLFLFDSSVTANLIGRDVFGKEPALHVSGTQLDWVQVDTEAQWLQQVESARERGYDIVVLGLYHRLRDDTGAVADGDTVLKKTMARMQVPSMALWSFSIGKGKAAAGLAHLASRQGRVAGEIALSLLRGDRGVSIPRAVEDGTIVISRSEALRQGFVIPPEIAAEALLLE